MQLNDGPIPYEEIAHAIETSISVDTIHEVDDEVFMDEILDTVGESISEPPVAAETMDSVQEIDISDTTEPEIENIIEPSGENIEVRIVLAKVIFKLDILELHKIYALSKIFFKIYLF